MLSIDPIVHVTVTASSAAASPTVFDTCSADSAKAVSFGEFIQLLLDAGMDEALYMDMGPGWNYSWYREYPDSNATWIHSASLSSATNWLVFCQV